MLSKWPIRYKLWLGIGLLLVLVATLAASGSYGLYAYRGLVRTLRDRSTELPLATELAVRVSDLRSTLSEYRGLHGFSIQGEKEGDRQLLREQFLGDFNHIRQMLDSYRAQLNANAWHSSSRIGEDRQERRTLAEIEQVLARIAKQNDDQDWLLDLDQVAVGALTGQVDRLQELAAELPSHLYRRFRTLASNVRLQYRTAIVLTWVTSVSALLVFALFLRLFYVWIFCPLRIIIEGSREVAAGRFDHRIRLDSGDEMSELAEAMNEMTARFQMTRDDLDSQVQERTRQVVRSEQLASVGFLAAGVAHEINNPLASIALCSESLQTRIATVLDESSDSHRIVSDYLRMIQEEAFRCKEITEKLLDFSRMGDVQRRSTDLRALVQDVVDMVRHLGRYQSKYLDMKAGDPVIVDVNSQEMKQVVLNLLTNALDSLEAGGTVQIALAQPGSQVELIVSDDGCGMTEEVRKHLFEPFFTCRRSGQGTGLGLSISFRIVSDHRGQIEAFSDGPGKGSRFVVTLPAVSVSSRGLEPPRQVAA